MESSGKTNPKETAATEAKKSEEHSADATSKETLSDLEHDKKLSSSTPDQAADETSVPSPDGQVERGSGGRADGSDTGGPM
jgi:hypothetical protein